MTKRKEELAIAGSERHLSSSRMPHLGHVQVGGFAPKVMERRRPIIQTAFAAIGEAWSFTAISMDGPILTDAAAAVPIGQSAFSPTYPAMSNPL